MGHFEGDPSGISSGSGLVVKYFEMVKIVIGRRVLLVVKYSHQYGNGIAAKVIYYDVYHRLRLSLSLSLIIIIIWHRIVCYQHISIRMLVYYPISSLSLRPLSCHHHHHMLPYCAVV